MHYHIFKSINGEVGMANSSKQIWVVVALVATGALFLVLAKEHKPDNNQGVQMQEVFNQTPEPAATTASTPETKADPIPSPAIVTMPVNGVEEAFAIQVFSFMDKNRADKSLEVLKQSGYKAFMEVSDLGAKGVFYRVRIGDIANETEARKMLEEIRRDFKSGFIIKPKRTGK